MTNVHSDGSYAHRDRYFEIRLRRVADLCCGDVVRRVGNPATPWTEVKANDELELYGAPLDLVEVQVFTGNPNYERMELGNRMVEAIREALR